MNAVEQSKRLRFAADRAGFKTAAAAARAIGVREGTFRHHYNGTRGLSIKVATRYGLVLGVEPLWLVSGQEPMSASDADKEAARISREMSPEDRAVWFQIGQSLSLRKNRP
jgi:hypothetical protein